MNDILDRIVARFEKINAIPRCSGNEGRLAAWLQQWAEGNGLDHRSDAAGNLVVRVPASVGYGEAPTVVFQGHMDMVCEKTPDSMHDFASDPIRVLRQGDWLHADRTTLGADNGIALAYALSLVEENGVEHPPLELLFTVDEESGLTGAKALPPDFLRGRLFLNVDSEEEGVFTIGCAGGIETAVTLELNREPLPAGFRRLQVVIGGLTGGHSGIDIHKQRANANELAARLLHRLRSQGDIHLVRIDGGSRHNAIARDATVLVGCGSSQAAALAETVAGFEALVRSEYSGEPHLRVRVDDPAADRSAGDSQGLTRHATDQVVHLLLSLPHGVQRMSAEISGLVETSSNLATVGLEQGRLHILSSQRSSVRSQLEAITVRIHATAALAGATAVDQNSYPAWEPNMASPLLACCRRTYQRLFGREPQVQGIHAGLECALVGSIYPGMDMISFGPNIEDPHSPDERLHVPSIGRIWQFLIALLQDLK